MCKLPLKRWLPWLLPSGGKVTKYYWTDAAPAHTGSHCCHAEVWLRLNPDLGKHTPKPEYPQQATMMTCAWPRWLAQLCLSLKLRIFSLRGNQYLQYQSAWETTVPPRGMEAGLGMGRKDRPRGRFPRGSKHSGMSMTSESGCFG